MIKRIVVLLMGLSGPVFSEGFYENDPPSFGGVLFPHLHANAAMGDSSRDPAELAGHGHDPNDQFTLQGIDMGLSLRAGEYVSGFANYNVFRDLEDDWDGEWEEAFLKFANLPWGLEVRAGRLFNRAGRQNSVHLHGWDFVDGNLINSRMLGDEGLVTNSVELAWNVPTPFDSVVSVAFGETVPHEEHGHGEEDEDGLEGEAGLFDTEVLSLRYVAHWNYNDFHQFQFGGTFITGDNGFMRTTRAAGVDVQYMWRENGLESGGRSLRWLTEVMGRDVEYQEEDGTGRGDGSEMGVTMALIYGFNEDWQAGLRYGWVEGLSELHELPERYRLSAAVTRRFALSDSTRGFARLQVNHEDHEEFGGEQSVWLQFGFDWGSPEVR